MSTHGAPTRHRENWKIGCKVYVGNLAEGASKADLESAFSKFGPLRNCWVARNPPGFAFVEFEDNRDAEDACKELDGTRIAGGRIKAEMSHGRSRRGRGGGPPSFGRGPPPYPYGGPGRGSYGASRGHYNGHDPYSAGHHGASRGGGYGAHGGHHGGSGYGMERGRDRYAPPGARNFFGGKDYRYSRSRSNSLGKSPPPQQRATARPRTPPSRSPSPGERH